MQDLTVTCFGRMMMPKSPWPPAPSWPPPSPRDRALSLSHGGSLSTGPTHRRRAGGGLRGTHAAGGKHRPGRPRSVPAPPPLGPARGPVPPRREGGREGGRTGEGGPGREPGPAPPAPAAPHLSEQRRLRAGPGPGPGPPSAARPWLGRCRCCSAWPRWAPAAGQGPPPPVLPGPPPSRCRTRRTIRRTSSPRYPRGDAGHGVGDAGHLGGWGVPWRGAGQCRGGGDAVRTLGGDG